MELFQALADNIFCDTLQVSLSGLGRQISVYNLSTATAPPLVVGVVRDSDDKNQISHPRPSHRISYRRTLALSTLIFVH